jgi:GNAT superfamily N-acetyltransferase
MTTQISIRPFESTNEEYAAISEIGNAVFPEYLYNALQIRYDDEAFDKKQYLFERHVAVESATQSILGYAEYSHMPNWYHPQKFWIWIVVAPEAQHQGIGTRLYERILQRLQAHRAISIKTQTREDISATIRFLQKRGFVEDMRAWESRLNVKDFSWEKFRTDWEAAKQLTITTLAEERTKNSDWLQQAYELHTSLMADVPSNDTYTQAPLEHFVRHQIENPDALLDGYFIAMDAQRWIGESFLRKNPDQPQDLYQGLTGVRREYRRQGVAMALKLKTIEYAQEHGYEIIKTWNATVNEGMLGINAKLGFVRQPAWITFVKQL